MRYYSHMHSIELGRDPKVKSVAKLVASVRALVHHPCLLGALLQHDAARHDRQAFAHLQINYSNKNALSAAMIVAGWDAEGGGQARRTFSFAAHAAGHAGRACMLRPV